jgi:two-component system, NtrC family, response regulator AtoC
MQLRETSLSESKSVTILVAEDEPEVRNYLSVALRCRGYEVEFAQNGEEALQSVRLDHNRLSLVLMDILMPCKDGLEALREMRTLRPDLPVIMLSGASSPLNIVTAMRAGAADFLPKPLSHDDLRKAIEKALPPALSELEWGPGIERTPVIGAWSKKLELLLRKIGPSDAPILLEGETGVGKEMVAHKLHRGSGRAGKPFLKLNCAALPSELVESELFGYERGAFTGAFKNTPGKFELANGGTILLDEIGDMDVKLQAKLLQVLQNGEFLRLGSKEVTKVDVRVMAATHQNLERAITEGRFREDLYYRLNVIDIRIPPLRERTDEILSLAEFFIWTHATPSEPALEIPSTLQAALLQHSWPGNIRELENVMRKFLILRNAELLVQDLRRRRSTRSNSHTRDNEQEASEDRLHDKTASLMPTPVAPAVVEADSPSVLRKVDSAHKAAEAEAIMQALSSSHWNRKQAALLLNIDYKALLYRMKKLGIGEKQASRANA